MMHLLRGHAGKCTHQITWLLAVAKALTSLGGAYAPLAVELFCGGALGFWLRLAQRLVASKTPSEQEHLAARLLTEGLVPLVQTFGLVVPQARAHSCPASAVQAACFRLLRVRQSVRCPSAQVAEVAEVMEEEVSAYTFFVCSMLLLHPAARMPWSLAVGNLPALVLRRPSRFSTHVCLAHPGLDEHWRQCHDHH